VTGDSGNDTVVLRTGNNGTVNAGTENDSIFSPDDIGSMVLFGSDGADTVEVPATTSAVTVVGGNDSNDGADSIQTGSAADLIFGNGGNDSVLLRTGADTVIGGAGNDRFQAQIMGDGSQLFFGNEGNDAVLVAAGTTRPSSVSATIPSSCSRSPERLRRSSSATRAPTSSSCR
jgi:hypothetical protein